jgi:hypothetical protein
VFHLALNPSDGAEPPAHPGDHCKEPGHRPGWANHERFTRAIEQLGSDQLEVRLGAIYALERIARDSERDHWPIMEILTAYVRAHAPRKKEEQRLQEEISSSATQLVQNNQPPPKLATDIQAIPTVLGQRTRTYGKGGDRN